MMKRAEEMRGVGRLECGDAVYPGVRYDVVRYQGYAASGVPVPGWFRVEGSIGRGSAGDVGSVMTLRLEDGRRLRVTLVDGTGRVLAEGHGLSRCGCC